MNAPGLIVVGIHGHGAGHREAAGRLHREGAARLLATVDPRPPATLPSAALPSATLPSAPDDTDVPQHFTNLADALAELPAEVVVLSTPLHTHAALATVALEAGCDVLLEKPAVTSIAEFDALSATAKRTGGRVQVGFQSMGSSGIAEVRRLVASGSIGAVTGYAATGSWARPLAYWNRNDWAGRRSLDGVPVVDGVLTNPLAHAVQTALRIADAGPEGVRSIELDQYRANSIDADDTSVVRILTHDDTPIVCALTLCARERSEPFVTVTGERGRIRFYYTLDIVQLERDGASAPETTAHKRTDLLRNLLAARQDPTVPLLCPLEDVRAFTQVVDAVRAAPPPRRIPPDRFALVGEGADRRVVVTEVERWVAHAAAEGRTFAEVGAPWV